MGADGPADGHEQAGMGLVVQGCGDPRHPPPWGPQLGDSQRGLLQGGMLLSGFIPLSRLGQAVGGPG